MKKETVRQFLTYSFGSISQSVLSFILLPLYLNLLTPSEYGIISLSLTLNVFLTVVANVGLVSGLYRLYYEKTAEERKALLGTLWGWHLFASAILCLALIIFSTPVAIHIFKTTRWVGTPRLLGIFLVLYVLKDVPFHMLRLEKKAALYVFFSLMTFVLDFSFKLIFVGVLRRGVNGYFESSILAYLITVTGLFVYSKKYVSFSFDKSCLGELFRLGFPYVFSTLSFIVLDSFDKFTLNHYLGTEAVGVYSLAFRFANLLNIVLLTPIGLYWTPLSFSFAAERKNDEELKNFYAKSLLYFFLAGGILAAFVSTGSFEVIRAMTHNATFWKAGKIVPLLVVAPFLYLVSHPAGNVMLQVKKTGFVAPACLATAAINIVLNLILIPRLHAYGAALALISAHLFLAVSYHIKARSLFPINYTWGKYLLAFAVCLIAFGASSLVPPLSPIPSLILKFAIVTIICAPLVSVSGVLKGLKIPGIRGD
ncbi:MAG: oligosaccharide flippase family protein [Candidatus Eisenbacteria bacterium]|nr:oligosaccharide flippase family protein [Candidatus Eisenbacteria bacterium]